MEQPKATPPVQANGLPDGSKTLPVAGTQAAALRAIVAQLKESQNALSWMGYKIADEMKFDVTNLICAGVQDEQGQVKLVFVPGPD